jgi:CHAT domain-containing protein/tetratricopeptide (TPR) repeat protein
MIVRSGRLVFAPALLEGSIMSRSFVPTPTQFAFRTASLITCWLALTSAVWTQPAEPVDAARQELLRQRNKYGAEARQLKDEGKLAEAIAAGEKMLTFERQHDTKPTPDLAFVLNWLGQAEMEQQDFAQGQKRLGEALDVLTKVYDPNHWKVTDARVLRDEAKLIAGLSPQDFRDFKSTAQLDARAFQFFRAGKYADAVPLAEKCCEIRKRVLGEAQPDYARNLLHLGLLYENLQDYARAEETFMQASEICKNTLGESHPDYAMSLHYLASLYRIKGDFARAEPLLRQSLKIRKTTLGEISADYAASLNSLAGLYKEKGEYARAVPLMQQALDIRKKTLGEMDTDYAKSLNDLASLYDAMGDYARAEPLYRQSLEIDKKVMGEEYPDYANTLSNLALLYANTGDYARAEPLDLRAMEIRKKVLGEAHPDYANSLNNLAALYENMGDSGRAEPLYLQAIAIRRRTLGDFHPELAMNLNNLALLYTNMGEYARAEPLYREALAIRKKALGEAHPDYAGSLLNLAAMYYNMGDSARAEPLYRQAAENWKKSLGEAHPNYANSLSSLGLLYMDAGNYAQAEPLIREALAIRKKALGETHPLYCDTLLTLAAMYHYQGNDAAARPLVATSLDIQLRNLERAAAVQTEQQQFRMTASMSVYLNTWLTVTLADPASAADTWRRVLAWKALTTTRQIALRRALKDNPTYTEFRQVSQQLSTVVLSPPLPPTDPATLAMWNQRAPQLRQTWQAEKEKLESDYQRLEKELSRLSAVFYHEHERLVVTPNAILASLRSAPQPTALVDLIEYRYFAHPRERDATEQRIVAFVVRPDRSIQRIELGSAATIQAEVAAWRKGFGRTLDGHDPAREVHRLLWEPLRASLDGIQTMLVSADGALAQLPWGAIPGDKPGQFLIEERTIAVLPAPQTLPELLQHEQQSGPPASLLLAGDIDYGGDPGAPSDLLVANDVLARQRAGGSLQFSRLDGAQSELASIKDWYEQASSGGMVKTLRRRQATEAAFRENAPQFAWLHVITHGFFAPPELNARLADVPSPDAPRGAVPSKGKIGLDLTIKAGHCVINQLSPGGAALKDGRLQAGDELVAIAEAQGEWSPLAGKDLAAIVDMIRGSAGTSVRLKVRPWTRPDHEMELSLTRAPFAASLGEAYPGLLSGLAFAGANKSPAAGQDDGILTSLEVSSLNLSHVDTVVLSACETGLGEVAGGEGLLGLQRSFQVAGAKTVVASLWKVPDAATSKLMQRFYENLWDKNMGKLAALREAQIWMLRDKGNRGLSLIQDQPADSGALPPFYWAAFVLSGDWR